MQNKSIGAICVLNSLWVREIADRYFWVLQINKSKGKKCKTVDMRGVNYFSICARIKAINAFKYAHWSNTIITLQNGKLYRMNEKKYWKTFN